MRTSNRKTAKTNRIKKMTPSVQYMKGMKKPTVAQTKHWEARLTRMGCSIYAGTHPRWLEYENEIGDIFFFALAEYANPQAKYRTGIKPQAD